MGCDWVLDSDAVDDECGICKGDGTQCKIIEDTYGTALGHGNKQGSQKSFDFIWSFCRIRESGDDTEGSQKYYL